MAYCLLGLSNINMPLLYGEGENKAFIRLQIEIINKEEDESILAWHMHSSRFPLGILAPHPRYFTNSGDIVPFFNRNEPRYWITNRGLALKIPAYVFSQLGRGIETSVSVPLYCKKSSQGCENPFRVNIVLIHPPHQIYQRARDDDHGIDCITTHNEVPYKTIYLALNEPF